MRAADVSADWADAPRADRYRVLKQVVDEDPDFVAAVTVTDSDASLWDLPSGATVNVRVTAVNDAGETQPSDVVSVVVV